GRKQVHHFMAWLYFVPTRNRAPQPIRRNGGGENNLSVYHCGTWQQRSALAVRVINLDTLFRHHSALTKLQHEASEAITNVGNRCRRRRSSRRQFSQQPLEAISQEAGTKLTILDQIHQQHHV